MASSYTKGLNSAAKARAKAQKKTKSTDPMSRSAKLRDSKAQATRMKRQAANKKKNAGRFK